MITILNYRISTNMGAVILIAAMSFDIINVASGVFENSIEEFQTIQRTQLNSIRAETNFDMSSGNTDNWNLYQNDRYDFMVKYLETISQETLFSEENGKDEYTEQYPDSRAQPLKISFENFTIKLWDNFEKVELKKYLVSDDFCKENREFCGSFKKSGEIALSKAIIAEKDWFRTGDKTQRFFIPSPQNDYILDFELTNRNRKKEFSLVLSTLEFTEENK